MGLLWIRSKCSEVNVTVRFSASTGNFEEGDLAFNQIQGHYVNLITLQYISNFIISFSFDSAYIQIELGILQVEHC